MANQQLLDSLLEAVEKDDPGIWEAARKEAANLASIHIKVSSESISSYPDAEKLESCYDLGGVDLSGRVFNSFLCSSQERKIHVDCPEKCEDTLEYLHPIGSKDYYFDLIDFSNSSFERSILRGCCFSNSQISNLNARQATFAFCGFTPRGTCFKNSDFQKAKFHRCSFEQATFWECQMDGAHFHHCICTGYYSGVYFRGCQLKGATFDHCTFPYNYAKDGPAWSAFYESNVEDARFLHCDLSRTGITRAQLETCASIEGSKLPPELEKVRGDIERAIAARRPYVEMKPTPGVTVEGAQPSLNSLLKQQSGNEYEEWVRQQNSVRRQGR